MRMKLYFDILGIPPTKNESLIKKAYRKKAMKYHPDRNPSVAAKDKFIQTTEAYDKILNAIEQAKNPKYTSQKTTFRQGSTKRQSSQTRTKTKTQTQEGRTSEREDRIKEAQERYKNMKLKEEQENERYYQNITTGKSWRLFMIIMLSCTLVSFIITLDMLVFPTKTQLTQITKKNLNVVQSGSSDDSGSSAVLLSTGQTAWLSLSLIGKEEDNFIYLERTLFFKDIKYVKYWRNNKWQCYVPDYGLAGTFPAIPLALLIPLLTYFIKNKTIYFSIMYHSTIYLMSVFLLVFLISNDRWTYLLTLGLLG